MPLRALLLLPEQPSTSGLNENNGAYNTLKLSVSTPAPSPRSSHARLDGYDYSTGQADANAGPYFKAQRGTSWSNVRKRLPSSGPDRERDPDQRASNQTYKTNLTLPTTSGTDHAPSPPLSPASSAISTRTSLRQNTAPLETDARGRPKLKVETKIPKVGSMVHYKHETNGRHRRGSLIESPVEAGTSKMDEDEIPSGEKTAREAVDARLQHLIGTQPLEESIPPVPPLPPVPRLSTTSGTGSRTSVRRSTSKDRRSKQTSTSRLSSSSNAPNAPTTSEATPRPPIPVRKPSALPPPSPVGLPVPVASVLPSPVVATMTIPPIPSTAKRKTTPSQAKKRALLYSRPARRPLPNDPPSPPTRGLPPYRIMSQADFIGMQVINDGKKIQLGWCKRKSFKAQRVPRPKGTKGKYIRLITLPVPEGEENEDDKDNMITVKRGKVLPKIQVNSNDRGDDSEEDDEHDKEKDRRRYVPTVYMTEIVASQFTRPVACMMWPPPPVSSLNSRTSRAARRLTKRLSTQSTASASPSASPRLESQEQVQTLPPLAYQFPLISLTPVQRESMISAGLLVYAVPRGYDGPVPPIELDVVENEVVAPWNRDALLSPRASMEANAVVPSSPRWGVEGVWNSVGSKGKDKAKGLTVNTGAAEADSRRISLSSVKSGATDGTSEIPPVPPIPAIFAANSSVDINRSASAPNTSGAATVGWASSFSSLRAKAQGYYAANSANSANSSPPSDHSGHPKPQHSAQDSQSSVRPATTASGTQSGNGGTISTSRSFGSFFSRAAATTPATTSTTPALTPGERIPDSGYASSVGSDKEDGTKSRASSSEEVLFDGDRNSSESKQPQTAPPTTTTTTTAAATPPKSWRSWAGRWGS